MAGELIEQLIAASQQPVVLDRLAWIWIELSEGGPIDGRIWRYEQRLPQAVAIATVSVRHSISYVSSSVMAFSNLDLRYATLRGLHFGCTDAERERLRGEKDSGWSAGYVGGNCRADFSESNLTHSDFQGAQLRLAVFEGAVDLSAVDFRESDLTGAAFTRVQRLGTRWPEGFARPAACGA